MTIWDESHWTDYEAEIINLLAGPYGGVAIEFRYTIGYVGWRNIYSSYPFDHNAAAIMTVAAAAKMTGSKVRLRMTNGSAEDGRAEIVAIQTVDPIDRPHPPVQYRSPAAEAISTDRRRMQPFGG